MSGQQREYFLIKYPSNVDLRQLDGKDIAFPNSGKFVLGSSKDPQVWEFAELDESLQRKLGERTRVLRQTNGKRTYSIDPVRIKSIVKLRRLPDKDLHKLRGK
jgi:hypothetical protein